MPPRTRERHRPLAKAVAVAALPPYALTWPDDDYWSCLVFASGTGGYTALQTSEALMPGDPPAPRVRPG